MFNFNIDCPKNVRQGVKFVDSPMLMYALMHKPNKEHSLKELSKKYGVECTLDFGDGGFDINEKDRG